jgi:hypothetical protein
MTEGEWLACDDPARMLYVVQGPEPEYGGFPTRKISDRKLRLFACACCRLRWEFLPDGYSRRSVQAAEEYADGLIQRPELEDAHADSFDASETDDILVSEPAWGVSFTGMGQVLSHLRSYLSTPALRFDAEAALLRDIVGNPFRPVTLPKSANPCERCGGRGYTPRDPAVSWSYGALMEAERHRCGRCLGTGRTEGPCPWLTPTVLSLAWAAYDGRLPDGTLDPHRLGVLSDALEEAGCTEGALLRHLRGPGPHARGCHALDLLLGKE